MGLSKLDAVLGNLDTALSLYLTDIYLYLRSSSIENVEVGNVILEKIMAFQCHIIPNMMGGNLRDKYNGP